MSTREIPFTPDSREVALRKLRQIQEALETLAAVIGQGKRPLDAALATNVLKVSEFELADLGKTLGVETDSAKDREERFVMLRAANLRVRELEGKLGNAQDPEVLQAGVKAMADRVAAWWRLEGFGHVRSLGVEKYGCSVTFSCSLFGRFAISDSPTPVTDKERRARWHASLRERGFVLAQDDRDWVLEDCDGSRKALLDLFSRRLPSARIMKLDNFSRSAGGCFVLHEVEVYINQISEILELPGKSGLGPV